MRTETKTYTNIVQIPSWFTVQGNQSGSPIQAITSAKSPGDGDIGTGNLGKVVVYAQLNAACKAEGRYARLDFDYWVWTSDWDSGKYADKLTFHAVRYIDLSMYDVIPRSWSYVTEKGEKATVQERFTWKLCSHSNALYIDYYKANKTRRGFLAVDNSYPQLNKPQSWIPRENLGFKIDDSGSERYKVGNIAFKAFVNVRVQVTRTVTTTYENIIDDNASSILAKDRALSNPTLDAILANRPIVKLKDGADSFQNNVIHDAGSTGAWLRGVRERQLDVSDYTFPHSTTNMSPSSDYYLGSIILVDDKFRSAKPTKVVLSDAERKPLSMYATNNRSNASFDNVRPTAKEMNNKKNEFIEKYLSKITDSTKVPSITTVDFKDFESTDGISIGGSVKGVDFGFSTGERKKKARVFVFKQVLFSLALDDTYKKGSEFFSDKLNLPEFRAAIKHYAPAVISKVYYGKVAYLAVTSDDNSAMSVNVSKADFMNGKASITGGSKKCSFKAIVLGGVAGAMNGTMNFTDLNDVSGFLKSICTEMKANDVEAAIPIEFEAKYLSNPSKLVTTDILPYFSKYVDKVWIKVAENNKGVSASARLRLIDYAYDSKGQMDYVFRSFNRSLDFRELVSPWACCIEIKVDVVWRSDGSEDFNIFIPYIPLSSLVQNSDGEWEFKINIGGSTVYDAKSNVTLSSTIPGCYVNRNNKHFRGDLPEAQYKGKTEDYLLTQYFNYCEYKRATVDAFRLLSSEKKNKTYRGND